jgi:two-component sensor histidine kinase
LTIETAVPCGLIINELLSNSLKHGFPKSKVRALNGRDGQQHRDLNRIIVELHANGDHRVTLQVRDNGIGFPDDLASRSSNSLGMQLVTSLVHQLDGTLDFGNEGGAVTTITFPLPVS